MKEVFKMSPCSVKVANSNPPRRMSVDGTTNLINNDSANSIISIAEDTTNVERSYSSKVIEVLYKNISYLIATSGNITAQMIISTTIAKTPWSRENVINSLLFSGGLIAADTLSEPHIFSALAKIKNWMIDKWKNNENDINLKKELMKVTIILLGLSYSGVLLDRASNQLLDNLFSVKIVEETGVEFLSYVINSTFHGAIISILEKGIKLSWRKFKSLFTNNNNDVERQLLYSEQDINDETEKNGNFFYQDFLPLCLITPISMFITWATEDCISNQEFTLNKMLTDAPKVTAGITLSLASTLLNCMINKEEIPFLPSVSTIKKWCGYQKKDSDAEETVSNPVATNDQDTSETLPYYSISSDFTNLDNGWFQTPEEQCIFEKLALSFKDNEEEIYFDTREKQEATLFNTQLVNNYEAVKNESSARNSLDSGISSNA